MMVEYSNKLFHSQILEAALQFGNDIAMTDGHSGENWTFERLYKWSFGFANSLRKLDAKIGDIVLLCVENCPHYASIFLGCALTGCSLSAINPESTAHEVKGYLRITKPKFLVIFADNYHLVKCVPDNCKVIVIDKRSEQNGYDFTDLVKSNIKSEYPDENGSLTLDHTLLTPFSSGTTGKPKCVQLTHRNFSAATAILKKSLFDELSHGKRRVTIGVLPFYHASGFWALCYCLLEGHRIIVIGNYHPAIMLNCIEQYKIDTLNVVPAIIGNLCQDDIQISRWDISSVKTVLCGSAALGKELSKKFLTKFPSVTNLVQGYGMTEIVILSHITPLGTPISCQHHLGSCGKLLPGFEAMILDEGTGRMHNKPLTSGELLLRSETVMKGYLGNQDETKKVIDSNGWLHTGDVVYFNSDGYYFVVDRIKDLIKVNGMQVSPAELEDILKSHKNVLDAGVVGIPDKRYGQVPKAFVVLAKKQSRDSEINEIIEYVHDRVSPHKRLRGGVAVLDALPKTSSGKTVRKELLLANA